MADVEYAALPEYVSNLNNFALLVKDAPERTESAGDDVDRCVALDLVEERWAHLVLTVVASFISWQTFLQRVLLWS